MKNAYSKGLVPHLASRILLAGAIAAVSAPAMANTELVSRTAPVLVTATLSEQTQKDAPAATTIITREQIKQTSAQDLAEVLRETTGISLTGRGVGNRRVMNIRGMESHHTLILVDGKRVSSSDAVVGHSDFQNSWVPTESIERIEVVRGALSSLYGSDGMGGVVNIITRRPGKEWGGNLNISSGTIDDNGRGGSEKDVSFNLGGSLTDNLSLRIDGEFGDHEKTENKDDVTTSEAEGKETSSLGLTFNYQISDNHNIELQHRQIDEDRPRDALSRSRQLHESTYELERRMTSLQYSGEVMETDVSAKLYRSSIDVTNKTSNGVAPSTPQKLIDTIAEAHVTRALGDHQILTLGGEYREEKLEHIKMVGGSDSITNKALFAQSEIDINRNTSITLGARLDDHEIFGSELSPRAYLVYQLTPEWTLKGGYGEGFRAPTLKQISPNYRFDGFHTFIGNPDLGPETSSTIEMAAQYHGKNLSGGITVFRNDVDDLVQTSCIVNCSSRFGREFKYINVDEARIDGIEMELNSDLGAGFDVSVNLTHLDTENRTTGAELEHRPKLTGNLKISWKSENDVWHLALRGQHIGKQIDNNEDLPSYQLWHLNARRQLTENLSVRAGVDNIANERLGDKNPNFSFEERSRFAYLGLDVSF